MSRTEVRGAAQPRGNPRPARGRAARIVGRRGLRPLRSPEWWRGDAPAGPREQPGVAKMRSATTDQPP